MKESHPIECTEYDGAQDLQSEPTFNWLVNYVLKKRERIISLVKKRSARYLKRNEKFGIALPNNIEEAHRLDKKTGNTLWEDYITIEMLNTEVAFKLLDNGDRAPYDYQVVTCHMIYNVKMEGFRRKARLVAGGHMTTAPSVVTYASVVLHESV